MPQTLKDLWDDLSIHSQQALQFNDEKLTLGARGIYQKFYSEEEVDKIIAYCINAKLNIEQFHRTGILSCPNCGKPLLKIDTHNFRPDCSCFRENLKVSIG